MSSIIWRDTAIYPRFWLFDARCLFPVLLWLCHARSWTFYIAISGVAIFALLEWYGISPAVGMRVARLWITGRVRPVSDRYVFRRRARW
ncbi:IcmT/TraK family protein (plasmid) [Nitratidesulfovibrio vulgaris]|jgi:intracellular multiplication protein IcmT|nr:IcmT/TraK family protein [Nitratidesulfovibrio vulgaris]WCB48142.1 IcmT/TraK family protein [Nitratidesulfovibrio vulgaris]